MEVDVAAWERLLGFHMERITAWSDGAEQGSGAIHAEGVTQVPWPLFDGDYWRTSDSSKEPPRHLIVRIAQECGDWLTDLCERPRRILRRVRTLLPIAQAQDVDDACIRWLTHQPGRTMPERAGPRQRILAVAREDSVDTPENRVLRDFLRLSTRAATRYSRTYEQFAESDRLRAVHRYLDTVRRLLHHTPIGNVPSLVGEPTRNYVLQFDARYSRMWGYYDRLRRQEDERDDLYAWRHRLWTEFCELLVRKQVDELLKSPCSAEPSGGTPTGHHVGPAILRREANHGHFFDARTYPGLWPMGGRSTPLCLRLHRTAELAKHPNPGIRNLAPLLPDLVLVEGPTFDRQTVHRVVGVWGLFAPMDSDEHARQRSQRLLAVLNSHQTRNVRGLLILPATDERQARCDLGTGRVTCLRTCLPDQAPTPVSVGASVGRFLRSVLA